MNIREKTFALVRQVADEEEVDGETVLLGKDGGLLDSFQFVELISLIQSTLGVELNEEDMEEAHFHTVGSLASFIAKKCADGNT